MVDEEWTLEVSFWKREDEQALAKWEAKAERAAGEIYLLVENDQRVHFHGFEEVLSCQNIVCTRLLGLTTQGASISGSVG